jgi:hypothetical protein
MSIDEDLASASKLLLGLHQVFERIWTQCPGDPHYLDMHALQLSKYTDKCEELLRHLINQRAARQR